MKVDNVRYSIYGVCATYGHSLFVDYICQPLQSHEDELLQNIANCSYQPLQQWQQQQQPQASELFEIECVDSKELAQEAVLFWQAYFSSLGETIVGSWHVCDEPSPQRGNRVS